MQKTIGGHTFDASFDDESAHKTRGVTVRMKCADGVTREGHVGDPQYAPAANHVHMDPVVQVFKKEMRARWVDLGAHSVRTCTECEAMVSATQAERAAGTLAKCVNKHDVP